MLATQTKTIILVALNEYMKKLEDEDASDYLMELVSEVEYGIAHTDTEAFDSRKAVNDFFAENRPEIDDFLSGRAGFDHAMRASKRDQLDLGLDDEVNDPYYGEDPSDPHFIDKVFGRPCDTEQPDAVQPVATPVTDLNPNGVLVYPTKVVEQPELVATQKITKA